MIAETEIAALDAAMAPYPQPRYISRRVNELTRLMVSGGMSPLDCNRVLAGTVCSAAVGLAGALSQDLATSDIHDVENLRQVVITLRAAADIFDVILKRASS